MNKFLTPDDLPSGVKVIKLYVPEGDEWEALVRGALVPLLDPANFERFGSLTPDETAAEFQDKLSDTFLWEVVT